jgi:dihydroorotate dehydrogenase electron transfer subunit
MMVQDLPQFPVQEMLCPVVSNAALNGEYLHLILDAPETALAAKPGQFFHLNCPPADGIATFLRRPMSIYRVDRQNRRIEFLYKNQGAGTRGLATLRPGDVLDVFGPLGQGFAFAGHRHVLIVARGVGLATMAPLAEQAAEAGARVTAVLSARTPGLIMSADYLNDVGADTIVVTDTDGSSDVATIEERLCQIHAKEPFDFAATCGSNRLLQMLKGLTGAWRIAGQIALEQHMACGIGMCFCCVRPFESNGRLTYRRVCFEGPVFDLAETPSW